MVGEAAQPGPGERQGLLDRVLRLFGDDPRTYLINTKQFVGDERGHVKELQTVRIEWTKDNHLRTKQSYRFYRWDSTKNSITQVKDWMTFDVK